MRSHPGYFMTVYTYCDVEALNLIMIAPRESDPDGTLGRNLTHVNESHEHFLWIIVDKWARGGYSVSQIPFHLSTVSAVTSITGLLSCQSLGPVLMSRATSVEIIININLLKMT